MDDTIDYQRRLSSDTGYGSTDAATNPTESARTTTGRYMLASGERPLDGYTIKRAIGRGGFGEVYYAVTDAGKEVALKLITRNLDVERRGVMQCMNLKSQHLIAIHDLRTNDEGDTFVIMEYVAGPSLASVLEKHPNGLPMEEVRHWLRGLVDGVSYLHDHGIVHRDLKPANLFLEEGVVKIGDYGLSKAITHSKEPGHSQSVGTCHYMAPEIGTGKYHKPIDIYAMGVILYEMITGRVPFDGESVQEVLMKHLTSRPDLSSLPEPYRTIVGRALAKDPNHRPTRVTDLLAPGDAPRSPEMRYIPESGKTAALQADGQAKSPNDEVLHIGAEEPVFYIGPETMPPRVPRVKRMADAARRNFERLMTAKTRQQSPPARQVTTRPAAPPPRVKPVVSRPAPRTPRAAPAQPPEPPPESPALPAGRARVAELATSMLLAAGLSVFATVLSVPFFGVFEGRPPQDPTQLAFIYAMILLGSWGVLIPSSSWDGRKIGEGSKRLSLLGMGFLVGLAGAGISLWAHLGVPGSVVKAPAGRILEAAQRGVSPEYLPFATLATYFALAFGANRFWRLTARDRRARFRVGPLVGAGVLAGLVGLLIPAPQPWGALIMASVALVTQISSPWSREAAAYAHYQEVLGRCKNA